MDTQELRTMKAVIFSVAVGGLLLWLVLLRAVADLLSLLFVYYEETTEPNEPLDA